MKNIPDNLKKLGFDKWFQKHIDFGKSADLEIARVRAVHKDSCMITNGVKDVFAEIVGKLMYSADSPLDFPVVGDWVFVQFYDEDTLAIIHDILPRKSLIKRKTAGKKVDLQLIAANIDKAFVIQSLDSNYNLRRLERYLAMIYESDIRPIILLSKSDLITSEEIDNKIEAIKLMMPQVHVQPFSNQTGAGLEEIKGLLNAGQTYCLLGSSGVGKTTLINNLVGEYLFRTKTVREKDSKGRHATTYRQLISLDCGAMIIDTPGMRELANIGAESGLTDTFKEIEDLTARCRYNDCTHASEKGCAVTAALEDGKISTERYQSYMKLRKESIYYEMSYLEKRNKDKQFGKLCKTVMKHKRNRK
jgi:ribosome biogenesis GTPase